MNERDGDFGAFLGGFIIGGLFGAITALLLAPQSGEETRIIIKDKSIELKDKAAESAEQARARVETTATEARARADELSQQAKQRADELRTSAVEVLEQQKKRVEAAVDAGKKATQEKPTEPEEDVGEAAADAA